MLLLIVPKRGEGGSSRCQMRRSAVELRASYTMHGP